MIVTVLYAFIIKKYIDKYKPNIASKLSYFNNIIEDILKMNNKRLNEGI